MVEGHGHEIRRQNKPIPSTSMNSFPFQACSRAYFNLISLNKILERWGGAFSAFSFTTKRPSLALSLTIRASVYIMGIMTPLKVAVKIK